MPQLEVTSNTTLPNYQVILLSVKFFTGQRWTPQIQSERNATFSQVRAAVGRIILCALLGTAGVGLCLTVIGAIIGIPLIIVAIILGRKAGLKAYGGPNRENLVVTTNPLVQTGGTQVIISYPQYAQNIISSFVSSLPPMSGEGSIINQPIKNNYQDFQNQNITQQQFYNNTSKSTYNTGKQNTWETQNAYKCPRCSTSVFYGVTFCSNCGTNLQWPIQQ